MSRSRSKGPGATDRVRPVGPTTMRKGRTTGVLSLARSCVPRDKGSFRWLEGR